MTTVMRARFATSPIVRRLMLAGALGISAASSVSCRPQVVALPSSDSDVADDSSATDAGAVDGDAADAGVADAGVADAGVADAGVADAGVADAGRADAGAPSWPCLTTAPNPLPTVIRNLFSGALVIPESYLGMSTFYYPSPPGFTSTVRIDYSTNRVVSFRGSPFQKTIWATINTAEDVYDWSVMDVWVQRLRADGKDIVMTLGYAPPWSTIAAVPNNPARDESGNEPSNMRYWAKWVTAIADRNETTWQGAIRYWEIENEPESSRRVTGAVYSPATRSLVFTIPAHGSYPGVSLSTWGFGPAGFNVSAAGSSVPNTTVTVVDADHISVVVPADPGPLVTLGYAAPLEKADTWVGRYEKEAEMTRVARQILKSRSVQNLVIGSPEPNIAAFYVAEYDALWKASAKGYDAGFGDGSGTTDKDWLDGIAIHPYTSPGPLGAYDNLGLWPAFTAAMARNGLQGKPVIVTEVWDENLVMNAQSAVANCQSLARHAVINAINGVSRMLWFAYDGGPVFPNNIGGIVQSWNALRRELSSAPVVRVDLMSDGSLRVTRSDGAVFYH